MTYGYVKKLHPYCAMLLHFVQFLNINGIQGCVLLQRSGGWFNKKISSYQYRKSHCVDKTILRPSYLRNGISYTGKTTSLYWIRVLTLLRAFQPMAAQLSKKAVLPLAKILATASCRSSKTGPRYRSLKPFIRKTRTDLHIQYQSCRCPGDIRRHGIGSEQNIPLPLVYFCSGAALWCQGS